VAEPDAVTPYAGYDVLAKWSSLSFDDTTRAVLRRRLDTPPERRFFSAREFRVLEAACARLLAIELSDPPIANAIDGDLFAGCGEGFRAPEAPRLGAAWHTGLAGLDAEAVRRHGEGFADLDGTRQDATLRALQSGDVDAALFAGIDAAGFFRDVLLKSAAAQYYSRPEAWSEIGYGGPASPRGYVRIALDRRDPWEAPLRGETARSR